MDLLSLHAVAALVQWVFVQWVDVIVCVHPCLGVVRAFDRDAVSVLVGSHTHVQCSGHLMGVQGLLAGWQQGALSG